MCFSAAIKAKINRFIFGAESESNMNPNVTIYDIKEKCKNEINIISGILKDECKKQIEYARRWPKWMKIKLIYISSKNLK